MGAACDRKASVDMATDTEQHAGTGTAPIAASGSVRRRPGTERRKKVRFAPLEAQAAAVTTPAMAFPTALPAMNQVLLQSLPREDGSDSDDRVVWRGAVFVVKLLSVLLTLMLVNELVVEPLLEWSESVSLVDKQLDQLEESLGGLQSETRRVEAQMQSFLQDCQSLHFAAETRTERIKRALKRRYLERARRQLDTFSRTTKEAMALAASLRSVDKMTMERVEALRQEMDQAAASAIPVSQQETEHLIDELVEPFDLVFEAVDFDDEMEELEQVVGGSDDDDIHEKESVADSDEQDHALEWLDDHVEVLADSELEALPEDDYEDDDDAPVESPTPQETISPAVNAGGEMRDRAKDEAAESEVVAEASNEVPFANAKGTAREQHNRPTMAFAIVIVAVIATVYSLTTFGNLNQHVRHHRTATAFVLVQRFFRRFRDWVLWVLYPYVVIENVNAPSQLLKLARDNDTVADASVFMQPRENVRLRRSVRIARHRSFIDVDGIIGLRMRSFWQHCTSQVVSMFRALQTAHDTLKRTFS